MPRTLISFDWAMKKLLRSKANFGILEGFLSELINDDIQIIAVLESESNQDVQQDKYNKVDLKVKNSHNEIFIIEVQHEYEFDYFQRILFGTSKVITEHLTSGDTYSKVVKVISVNILYFDLGQGEDYIYRGLTTFQGIHHRDTLTLSDKQNKFYSDKKVHEIFPEYYLIKVNSFNNIAKNTLDEWIYFLKNSEIHASFKAKGLNKAQEALNALKLSKSDRLAYEKYEDNLHYKASMYESSYYNGMEKGIEKGIQKGMEKGINEIAIKLLRANLLDRQSIAKITGLSLKEVETLSMDT